MFLVLDFIPVGVPPKKRRLRRAEPALQPVRVALPRAFSFYRLPIDPARDVSWDAVAALAETLRLPVLLPRGASPPCALPRFFETRFFSRTLMNGAVAAVAEMNRAAPFENITVADAPGVTDAHLCALAPFAATLTVVTAKKERFAPVSRQLLHRFGVSLLLQSRFDAPRSKNCVYIQTGADDVPLQFSGVVFTDRPKPLLNARVLTSGDVTLPAPFNALCPERVERRLFAAALSERCRVRTLESLAVPFEE